MASEALAGIMFIPYTSPELLTHAIKFFSAEFCQTLVDFVEVCQTLFREHT
jgi:hypothetical protein